MARSRTEILPVVPLRGRVVFPNTTLSFDVGRIVSLTAVKNATEKIRVCSYAPRKTPKKPT